jgi:hypothetical protein
MDAPIVKFLKLSMFAQLKQNILRHVYCRNAVIWYVIVEYRKMFEVLVHQVHSSTFEPRSCH